MTETDWNDVRERIQRIISRRPPGSYEETESVQTTSHPSEMNTESDNGSLENGDSPDAAEEVSELARLLEVRSFPKPKKVLEVPKPSRRYMLLGKIPAIGDVPPAVFKEVTDWIREHVSDYCRYLIPERLSHKLR